MYLCKYSLHCFSRLFFCSPAINILLLICALIKILLACARKRNRFVYLVMFQYYQVFKTNLGLSYIEIAIEDTFFKIIFLFLELMFPGLNISKMIEVAHYSKVKSVDSHVKCMCTLYFSMTEKELVFSKPQQSSSSHYHADKKRQ